MVNALLLAVTGKADASDAWSTLVTPADRVGIKVAASGGPFFSSHKTIVETVADGIMRAGVPRKNIIVWDRADMSAFPRGNYIVRSMEPITGYDSRSIFTAPLMGKLIWGDASFTRKKPGRSSGDEAEELSGESHFCKVLGQLTKIVNVPVLSSAESCGVAGCLYNATIPNVDNWRRFVRAPDPALCELYRDARIGPKVVLNIVDGLIAQFAGGPDFQPSYAWAYATIFASKDPVALDAVALREIENWRAQAHLPSLAGQATYLQTADAMGLGRSAPEEIDIGGVWPK
ncbi:MAG: hypothetical protein QOD99_2545 [Chthoniobacter sp.]|nr:hypothetical protein [Chthoniobacter sp.]